ncbi:hypothetical protein CHU92_00030, partial [Flavobacterium cyanobacteriorum]
MKILKFIAKASLLLVLLLLTNCQVEEDFITSEKSGRQSVQKISFDEIASDPKLLNQLENLASSGNSFARAAGDEVEYYYDKDEVLKITYDDYETYTFLIHRLDPFPFVENLVVRRDSKGTIDSYITTYNFTDAETNAITKGLSIDNIVSKIAIHAKSDPKVQPVYKRDNGTCYIITVYGPDGKITPGAFWELTVECPQSYDETSVIDPGNGNVSGGGGSGGGGGFGGGRVVIIINPGSGSNPNPSPSPSLPGLGSGSFPRGPVRTTPVIDLSLFGDFRSTLTIAQRNFLFENPDINKKIKKLIDSYNVDYEQRK